VVTLRGPMDVRVRVLHCPDHPDIPVYPKPMRQLFLPGCRFDMNVMNAVGLLRWGLCLQREEIRVLLMGRGVKISTGEISYLSERFLAYFYLHPPLEVTQRSQGSLNPMVGPYSTSTAPRKKEVM